MEPIIVMEDMYDSAEAMGDIAGFFGAFLIVWLIMLMVILAYSIVAYVMGSLGMYQIAKRRGIHNPWLAWVPVGCVWILGSISDHYQYIAKGKTRNFRKVLLWLAIGAVAVSGIGSMVAAVSSIGMTAGALSGSENAALMGMIGTMGMTSILSLITSLVAMASSVFQYICEYDLFVSCKPKNAVLFLVLSILLGIAPFLMFACRNADEGMPPKIRAIEE